jgi:hypothetical protein
MFLAAVIFHSGKSKRDWVDENKRLTWRHRLIMTNRCRSIWLGPLSWCRFDHKLFAQYHILWCLTNVTDMDWGEGNLILDLYLGETSHRAILWPPKNELSFTSWEPIISLGKAKTTCLPLLEVHHMVLAIPSISVMSPNPQLSDKGSSVWELSMILQLAKLVSRVSTQATVRTKDSYC